MSKRITQTIQEYSSLHPATIWDYLKSIIKKDTIKFARKIKSEQKLAISQLYEKVSELQSNLPLPEKEDRILQESRKELNELVLLDAKSAIFRSKVQWYELGEKSSKYFYSLEKSRYNAKTCFALIDENVDGGILRDQTKILEKQKEFYEQLYTADSDIKFNLINTYGIEVNKEEKTLQGINLTYEELDIAVRGLKKERTPGPDGIPADFYKVFWSEIRELLYKVYESAYAEEQLPELTMSGILNLIPKPNKDSRYLKNLRPITLLNTDYKIIEKVIANRMLPCLHRLIHENQTGFMPGRRISINIRKILDILEYTKIKKIPGLILNLDYQKVFDRIEISSTIKALQFFSTLIH